MNAPSHHLRQADLAQARQRWTPGRKESLLTALRRQELTFDEACQRYGLTEDELRGWQERFRLAGRDGLATTKLQEVGR